MPPQATEGNVVTSPESFLAAEILLWAVWLQPLDPASPIPFLSSTVQPRSPEEFCFPGHDALLSSVWCCPSCAYCSLCMKDTCVLTHSPRYGLSGSMEMLPRRHLPCIRGRRCPGAPAYQRNRPIITLPFPLQLSVPSLGDQPPLSIHAGEMWGMQHLPPCCRCWWPCVHGLGRAAGTRSGGGEEGALLHCI